MIYDIWYIYIFVYIYNQQYSWNWRALKGVWSQSFSDDAISPRRWVQLPEQSLRTGGSGQWCLPHCRDFAGAAKFTGWKRDVPSRSKNRTVRLRHEDVLCSSLCLEVLEQSWAVRQKCQAHMGFRHENVCVLHDVYPGQKKSLKAKPDLLHPVHPNKISTSISARILPSELQCHQCPGISRII